jgi:hypothetical protein
MDAHIRVAGRNLAARCVRRDRDVSINLIDPDQNDWIRHERSRHHQKPIWVCCVPVNSTGKEKCTTYFRREQKEEFEKHLDELHDLTVTEDREKYERVLEESSISSDGQPSYWCGFCRKILSQNLVQIEDAYSHHKDRFDHIDNHFKAQDMIEDWVCYTTNKARGEGAGDKEDTKPSRKWSSGSYDYSVSSQTHQAGTPTLVVTQPDGIVESRQPKKRKNSDGRTWQCVS